jgi:outer membrane biosynthesis protein TonB
VVDIDIGDDLTIRDVRVRKESGNALFDQSVIDRIRQLQEADATLPEPPDEVRDDYVGKTIGLRFRGKDAS